MDLFQNATDDQIALMGCFVAIIASAALMYVSVFLNRSNHKIDESKAPSQTLPIPVREDRSNVENSHRKVA